MDCFAERAAVIRQSNLENVVTVQINACAVQADGRVRELGIKTGLTDGRGASIGENASRVVPFAGVIEHVKFDGETIRDARVTQPANVGAQRGRTARIILDGKS